MFLQFPFTGSVTARVNIYLWPGFCVFASFCNIPVWRVRYASAGSGEDRFLAGNTNDFIFSSDCSTTCFCSQAIGRLLAGGANNAAWRAVPDSWTRRPVTSIPSGPVSTNYRAFKL